MSKQLVFVSGTPYSGRTTWVNKNLLGNQTESTCCIDANDYPSLYVGSKISEESIEASRQWCLEQVSKLMGCESPTQTIILCLIACRADRWRDFIQLAISNDYEISFRFPSNKLLFYVTKHNTTVEQLKFIESKCISKYPRDKKEVKKRDSKSTDKIVYKDTNESTLLRNVVTDFESGYAFYLANRMKLGSDKEAWLKVINEYYKVTIANDIKRVQKKAEKKAEEEEKAKYRAEKEARRLAREEAEEQRKLNEENEEDEEDNEMYGQIEENRVIVDNPDYYENSQSVMVA
jgi:hypothetical protein